MLRKMDGQKSKPEKIPHAALAQRLAVGKIKWDVLWKKKSN
jgi:hypothetical protein